MANSPLETVNAYTLTQSDDLLAAALAHVIEQTLHVYVLNHINSLPSVHMQGYTDLSLLRSVWFSYFNLSLLTYLFYYC